MPGRVVRGQGATIAPPSAYDPIIPAPDSDNYGVLVSSNATIPDFGSPYVADVGALVPALASGFKAGIFSYYIASPNVGAGVSVACLVWPGDLVSQSYQASLGGVTTSNGSWIQRGVMPLLVYDGKISWFGTGAYGSWTLATLICLGAL